jgi:hypothetical protein
MGGIVSPAGFDVDCDGEQRGPAAMPENAFLTHAQLKTPKAGHRWDRFFAAPAVDPLAAPDFDTG